MLHNIRQQGSFSIAPHKNIVYELNTSPVQMLDISFDNVVATFRSSA